MADLYRTDYLTERQSAPGARVGGTARIIGAALSAALILGAGVWGYKLLVRAANGIPVVHASVEPMRVQPMAPGGEEASHQGLSVNDVAADGASMPPADRIVLAPPAAELIAEDLPAAMRPDEQSNAQELTRDLIIDRLVSDIVAEAAPVIDPVPGGIGQSRRPVARPDMRLAGEVVTSPAPATAAVSSRQAGRMDPSALKPGTRLAQLGAFESADMAEQAWGRLVAEFREFLEGRSYLIQPADSGGQTVYRLRTAGFDDLDEARRLCSALAAEQAECIPLVIR